MILPYLSGNRMRMHSFPKKNDQFSLLYLPHPKFHIIQNCRFPQESSRSCPPIYRSGGIAPQWIRDFFSRLRAGTNILRIPTEDASIDIYLSTAPALQRYLTLSYAFMAVRDRVTRTTSLPSQAPAYIRLGRKVYPRAVSIA